MTTPTPDLAPLLPSRVLKGRSTDITERQALKGQTITFSLSQTVRSVGDKTDLEKSEKIVRLDAHPDGSWEIPLPVSDPAVTTLPEVGQWSIKVKYSTRPEPFDIQIPPGEGPIDITDVGVVIGVAPEFAGWVVTGMQIGTVTAGASAAARISGQAPTLTLDLTIPQGEQGIRGPAGPANVLAKGTVTTAPPGAQADITITGTAPNQQLSFTIPRGDKGATGDRGPIGPGLTILGTKANTGALPATGTLGDGWLIGDDLHVWNGTAWQNVGPVRGPQGDIGKTPQLAATASTLAPGAPASATVGGTAEAPALTIGVPRGRDGTTITSITQPDPLTLRIQTTADGGTATTKDYPLPVAKTSFTEVRPGVWQPVTTT